MSRRRRKRPISEARIVIPAVESRLAEVREFVSRTCRRHGFAERPIANVRLAVDQACTHVMRHAYPNLPGEIGIEIERSGRFLELRVRDRGLALEGVSGKKDLVRWLESHGDDDLGVVLLHRLVDAVTYESSAVGNVWRLRVRLPRRAPLTSTLRGRYSMRSALVLALLTAAACVPLWILEGERQRQTEERALQALGFALVEAARPVLRERQELSSEQTRLIDSVHELKRREPRLLSIHIVDHEGVIWAADRAAATFTHFTEAAWLGRPNAEGTRQGLRRIEKEMVKMVSVPVRGGSGSGRPLGSVFLSMRWGEVETAVREARIRLLLGALAVYALATTIVAGLIAGILAPVQRLVDGLRHAEGGDLAVDGPEEIGAIAAAFNDVSSRMQVAEDNAAVAAGLQQDLQLAREIQETLLPQQPPDIDGYEVARIYRPAADVGGDYYDFLQVNDDMTGVVVADVSGKGVPGSLVMGMLRTALRMEARDNTNAGDVLARMNAFLSGDMRKGMFVTMFYVILDSRNRVVSYASAGHTPMVLYRAATSETFFLKPRGFPVGLQLPDEQAFGRSLDVERLQLHEGDLLVLYTDGITEALDAERRQYGEDRLLEVIRRHGGGSAQGCAAALEEDLRRFSKGAPQSDDLTVVVIRETSGKRSATGSVRRKLIERVEKDGVSVEAACRELKVSPSTYYRFRHQEEPGAVPELKRPDAAASTPPAALPAPAVPAPAAPAPAAVALPELAARDLVGSCIDLADDPDAVLVHLEGFIDSRSCADLERFLAGIARKRWIVDLSGIVYLSSRAWGLLAATAPRLQQQSGSVVLCGLRPEVADVHRMLGFENVLPAFETTAAARRALQGDTTEAPAHGAAASPPVDKRDPAAAKAVATAGAKAASPNDASANPGSRRKRGKPDKQRQAKQPKPQPVAAATVAAPVAPAAPLAIEQLTEGEWDSLRVTSGLVGPEGEVRLLSVEGLLDTVTAPRFAAVLQGVVDAGAERIIVDLSRTEFISSAGWGTFAACLRQLRDRGGDLMLFGMGPELRHIFEMLNLGAVLQSWDVLSEALEAFGLQAAPALNPPSNDAPPPQKSPVQEALHEALATIQSTARLVRTRIDDPDRFAADVSVRTEGWQRYLALLVEAREDE